MSEYLSSCSRMRKDEGVYIPSELWADILKRVPARKLLQLQCVCKSWKSLISSSSFVSCHIQNTISSTSCVTSSGGSRLQSTKEWYDDKRGRPSTDKSCALVQQDKFTPLGYPNIPTYRLDDLWRPGYMFHGVIFLRYVYVKARDNSLLCVWNPCIRKHVVLPWPAEVVDMELRSYYRLEGICFDAANNDFKVVRSQLEGYYDLLSVRSGVWRTKIPFPATCLIPAGRRLCGVKGTFFNGSLHWIVAPDHRFGHQLACGHYQFLRFDCQREEFSIMDIPTQLVMGSMTEPALYLLDLGAGTMLSLAKFLSPTLEHCELWLMQHPGSWSRLDRNHPNPTLAAAATRPLVSCSGLHFEPLLHHHPLFNIKHNHREALYPFKETMMLMDIGKPSSSKLHHRYTD